jgi:hypothetical protein
MVRYLSFILFLSIFLNISLSICPSIFPWISFYSLTASVSPPIFCLSSLVIDFILLTGDAYKRFSLQTLGHYYQLNDSFKIFIFAYGSFCVCHMAVVPAKARRSQISQSQSQLWECKGFWTAEPSLQPLNETILSQQGEKWMLSLLNSFTL